MKVSKSMSNSGAAVCLVALGQTPDYLDPQSQEAQHEVDVSGMELRFSSGNASERRATEKLGSRNWLGSVSQTTGSRP